MNTQTIREFRLSPPGGGRGISCDVNGAFVGSVPLLKRARVNGRDIWQPRECGQLSKQIGANFGLPIDMSSKMGGLNAISRALNEGDIARAQVATVLLGIPEPPSLSKGVHSRGDLIKFIRDLHWSGLIKSDWNSDEHPRWPAGAPDSQGGRFAPKETSAQFQIPSEAPTTATNDNSQTGYQRIADRTDTFSASRRKPSRKLEEECLRQYDEDTYICNSLLDPEEAAICHHSAAERYGNCLAGRQIPPLTLPEPEERSLPAPATPAPRLIPPRPPWWLPFLLLPLLAGIPA